MAVSLINVLLCINLVVFMVFFCGEVEEEPDLPENCYKVNIKKIAG
jgi:hypothetical protein